MTWPFENDTSAVEKKLAKRSLAADKRRNQVVILTITLAVCLMALFAFIFTALRERTIAQIRGQYQSGVENLSMDEIKRLVAAGKFERWGYQSSTHNIRYRDANLTLQFYDEGMLALMGVEPVTGKYPEEENEICPERKFLQYFGLPQEVGDEVWLDLGDGGRTYVISSILEKENESRQFDVYISEALAISQGGERPFAIRFRFAESNMEDPKQLKADIKAFYQEMGIPEENIFFSSNYFDLSDLYLGSDMSIYGAALLIAVVCAVVIYNIFYISVMGKVKEYGRLKVIGTTPRQLRQVVRRQRRILMWISIFLGLLTAALLTVLLFPGYWNWSQNLQYTIFIVIVTVLMVTFSTYKPLKMAGQVSAIEAVRSNAYQALSGTSRTLHRPLSVFRLAAMNFSRNRKKAVLTMISLGLTGVLTACLSAYAASVDEEELARNSFGDGGEYIVSVEDIEDFETAQREELLGADTQKALLDLPDVEFITSWSAGYFLVAEAEKETERSSPQAEKELMSEQEQMKWILVGGFTKEQMKGFEENGGVQEGTADYDALLENDGILVTRDMENLLKLLYHLDLSVGDVLTLKSEEGISKDYTVMGIVDYRKGCGTVKLLILPEEELHTLYPVVEDFTGFINIHAATVSDGQRQALYTLLDDPRITISCLEDSIALTRTNLRQILILLYGVVIFISLFALINLINTLMTNLLARQQEFGILQSVGMTGRQLSAMIADECLCYVAVTLLITLSLGTVCGIWIVGQFNQLGLFGRLTWNFPWGAMLIFAGVLLVVYGVFSRVAVRFLQKRTLVERIKGME